jgi:hypothetical protein
MKLKVLVGLAVLTAAISCATASNDRSDDDDSGDGGDGAQAGDGGSGNQGNTGNDGGTAGAGNDGGTAGSGNDGGVGGDGGTGGDGGSGPGASGDSCGDAIDLSGATFPHTEVGTFDVEPPIYGSCVDDFEPGNGAWFEFTPTVTATYRIELQNATSTEAYSRVAVYDGCGGAEVGCATYDDLFVIVSVPMTAGTSYKILFHTDDDVYTMVNPTVTIEELMVGPGDACLQAFDVTAAAFPHTEVGQFEFDPTVIGSCVTDAAPANAVWFTYTPAATGPYQIELVNNTFTAAYSRVTVYDACGGAEVACSELDDLAVDVTATLTAGTAYKIVYHTDDDAFTMVDPSIDITSLIPGPGEECAQSFDVSAVAFPHTQVGVFDVPPTVVGTCVTDTEPANVVWFSYTPTASASYTIALENQTSDASYSRMTVYNGCGGAEVACETFDDLTVSLTTALNAGTTYKIAYHTDDPGYSMVDPIITITP